jgi:hypothetical protein
MDINMSIKDAEGREWYSLGGDTAWKTATYKGWCVSLEWFIGGRSAEPMMVIWPEVAEREGGAWAICLSSIGAYCQFDANGKVTGTPTAYAKAEAAAVLVEQFDRAPLTVDVHGLLDVVMHFAPDLIVGVPPAPMEVRRARLQNPLLEVTRLENGRKVAEASI